MFLNLSQFSLYLPLLWTCLYEIRPWGWEKAKGNCSKKRDGHVGRNPAGKIEHRCLCPDTTSLCISCQKFLFSSWSINCDIPTYGMALCVHFQRKSTNPASISTISLPHTHPALILHGIDSTWSILTWRVGCISMMGITPSTTRCCTGLTVEVISEQWTYCHVQEIILRWALWHGG